MSMPLFLSDSEFETVILVSTFFLMTLLNSTFWCSRRKD
uniref:Uncharacterized protein n=1 Tax=Arundo donax TaxID=35708 RepID=A0A0A8ZC07_ARUDO